jgi:hypothetical protein
MQHGTHRSYGEVRFQVLGGVPAERAYAVTRSYAEALQDVGKRRMEEEGLDGERTILHRALHIAELYTVHRGELFGNWIRLDDAIDDSFVQDLGAQQILRLTRASCCMKARLLRPGTKNRGLHERAASGFGDDIHVYLRVDAVW